MLTDLMHLHTSLIPRSPIMSLWSSQRRWRCMAARTERYRSLFSEDFRSDRCAVARIDDGTWCYMWRQIQEWLQVGFRMVRFLGEASSSTTCKKRSRKVCHHWSPTDVAFNTQRESTHLACFFFFLNKCSVKLRDFSMCGQRFCRRRPKAPVAGSDFRAAGHQMCESGPGLPGRKRVLSVCRCLAGESVVSRCHTQTCQIKSFATIFLKTTD